MRLGLQCLGDGGEQKFSAFFLQSRGATMLVHYNEPVSKAHVGQLIR